MVSKKKAKMAITMMLVTTDKSYLVDNLIHSCSSLTDSAKMNDNQK